MCLLCLLLASDDGVCLPLAFAIPLIWQISLLEKRIASLHFFDKEKDILVKASSKITDSYDTEGKKTFTFFDHYYMSLV
jgi:hypothetical protein